MKSFIGCKLQVGGFVSTHVLKMKGYFVLAIRENVVKRKKTSDPIGKGKGKVGGSNPTPKKDNWHSTDE